MISATIHRTCKQRWFSFIVVVAASLLPMIATLNSTPVQAAQAMSSSLTISNTAKLPINPSSNPLEVAMVVFFTRPLSCAQNSQNCQDNVKSYGPDNKWSCSSPISISVDSSASSWVRNGEECPYLTCNYLSITSCTAQSSKTVFRSLPQPIPNVGDSYMFQLLKFNAKDVGSAGTLMLNGCIYYANWPQFPTNNTQLALSWPSLKVLSKTPVPPGVNMQKILGQPSLGSTKTRTGVGPGTGNTGWNVQPNS